MHAVHRQGIFPEFPAGFHHAIIEGHIARPILFLHGLDEAYLLPDIHMPLLQIGRVKEDEGLHEDQLCFRLPADICQQPLVIVGKPPHAAGVIHVKIFRNVIHANKHCHHIRAQCFAVFLPVMQKISGGKAVEAAVDHLIVRIQPLHVFRDEPHIPVTQGFFMKIPQMAAVGDAVPDKKKAFFCHKLSLLPHKKQCKGTRAGMCTDGGPYIINEVRLDTGPLFHQLFQPVGILNAIPVADKNDVIFIFPGSLKIV